jgi:predicted nicotinamide N-methyase
VDWDKPSRHVSPAQHHRLLRRIEARYRVVTETVTIGRLSFPFTRIAQPDRVLDDVAAEEDRLEKVSGKRADGDYLHLPYWAELWDSATGVALALERGVFHRDLDGDDVLDLGCGMGLSGTVAAALGAHVLFADLETPALLFAQLNSLPFSGRKRWRKGFRCSQRVRTSHLDWRKDQLGERFDLIVGADILYERNQWEHLERFWRGHLIPRGDVLLAEPNRPTGDLFPDWIRQRGWTLITAEQPVPTRPRPVRLFLLSHPA